MIRKIPSIFQSYLYFLLFKAGFINDVNYKRVLRQRTSACEDCVLREGNWCSRKKSIVVIKQGRKYVTVKGCGCYLPSKIFDDTPDPCVLHKWEDFTND
jgi:hypothetical protein